MTPHSGAHLIVSVGARDHILGSNKAPVTLVEYGDYQCPYCGEAHPVVKELQKHLGRQVRFVYRNFPLAKIHTHAQQAAEAAETAGAQGKFWEMHDVLFENQDALDDAALTKYAVALGLDHSQFVQELADHIHAPHVREDFLGGARSGVNGTPTFFINGARHDDACDFDTLLAAIETELQAVTGGS